MNWKGRGKKYKIPKVQVYRLDNYKLGESKDIQTH